METGAGALDTSKTNQMLINVKHRPSSNFRSTALPEFLFVTCHDVYGFLLNWHGVISIATWKWKLKVRPQIRELEIDLTAKVEKYNNQL